MRKRFFFFLFILSPFISYSQNDSIVSVNLSLWNPIATKPYNSFTTTRFTFGLFQSKVHHLSGFGLNGIGSIVGGDMSGANISGLYSFTKGNAKGVLGSGFSNVVLGEVKGVEVAGLLNMNLKSMRGLQFSGISNMTIEAMRGWQISGGYNVASSEMRGLQLAGIANITAKGSYALQIAGMLNVSLGSMKGVQVGIGNFADTIKGVQFGLFNVSSTTSRGLQVGLVNYSNNKSGLKIGLVNISPTSKLDFMVYGSNYLYINMAARIQNKYTYSIIGIGLPYHGTDEEFSGGVFYRYGVYKPIKRFNLRADIGVYFMNIFDESDYKDEPMQKYSLQGRLSADYLLSNRLSLFVSGGWSFTSEYGEAMFDGKPIFEGGISIFLTSFSEHN